MTFEEQCKHYLNQVNRERADKELAIARRELGIKYFRNRNFIKRLAALNPDHIKNEIRSQLSDRIITVESPYVQMKLAVAMSGLLDDDIYNLSNLGFVQTFYANSRRMVNMMDILKLSGGSFTPKELKLIKSP